MNRYFSILFAMLFLLSSCAMFASKIVEEEITFYNGKLKFGGTLTLPTGEGKFPLVILISGSGQQNRDEEIMGFKPFADIAMHLSSAGYAVFRYDDRGVDSSKNTPADLENATVFDFAKDAYSALQEMKNHKKVNPAKIGFLGHSEGGVIAQKLAADYPKEVNFIILMASPAVSGVKISRYQVEQSNKEAGLSAESIDTVLKYQDMLTGAVIAGKSGEELKQMLYDMNVKTISLLPAERRKFITDVDKYVRAMSDQMLKSVSNPYIKEYFRYDPVVAMRKIKCPTLAIFGEKDMQVPVSMNKAALSAAFEGRKQLLEIVIIKDANHLFQKAETGSVSEYYKLEKKFEDTFLQTIETWLKKKIK